MDISLLEKICQTAGPSGFESRIRKLVLNEVKALCHQCDIDAMGNIIAIKKGQSSEKKIMVAAHMDEIGFIVTHITGQGFLKFHTLGGFDPKTLTAQRVIVHGKKDLVGVMGSKPVHVMSAEEKNKAPKTKDFFIDLGMEKKEVEKYINIGSPVTREREFIEMGDCVNGKSLDNRVSVFILIETLKKLKNTSIPFDLHAVFTVQEEVGLRGAMVAAHHISPDFSIGLDTTIAFDVPGAAAHERITTLGEGVAIKIMDASAICDYRMVEYMKRIATKNKLAWQAEILTAGGTDTAGMQRMATNGTIAGAISIPTRHIHQVIEMCHKKDIQAGIDLLSLCLRNIDKESWSF